MIEILSYKPTNHGKKIGFVEVYVPKLGLVLRHLAHLQSGDRRWVNYPTYSEEDGDKKQFLPYFSFKQNTYNNDFLEQVNIELQKYFDKHGIVPPEPLDLSGPEIDECPF